MSYTNGLDKPSDYFNTVLYTGNGASTHAITGVGFQPDLNWHKIRNDTDWHMVNDSVRGANYAIYPNENNSQGNVPTGLKSFDSDGFTVGNLNDSNQNNGNFVSWNWKAGTSFTNDASATGIGSIDSAGSVNQDAGFSICSYTGIGSTGTIKHGLNTAPSMIIIKNRSTTNGWEVYHQSIGNTKYLALNVTDAALASASRWNNTSPTSTVFTVNTEGGVNSNGGNLIAYCFAEKQGYLKTGKWTGNGNADGPFSYTGFKPAFILIKRTDVAKNWYINDNLRLGYNINNPYISPNITAAETGGTEIDILSNGFKIRASGTGHNQSGGTYIYMAIAENPFVTSTGVPATAR